ncbi:MAG: hypothetical protein J0I06_08780 [Planctomycetes bacterium]|nr:hypothetical protein [Planctomycetota bacterium]
MSRRPAWVFAFTGFVFGLVVVLFSGDREVVAQPKAPVIVAAPQAPTLSTPASLGAGPGTEVEIVLTGTNLAEPTGVVLGCPATVTIPTDNKNGTEPGKLRAKVAVDAKCPAGLYTVRVATKHGVSNARPFVVDSLPLVASAAANRTKDTAQELKVPCVASGSVAAEASEFFKVKVGTNQKLTFEVLARRIGSPLDPIVVLHDAKTKRELIDLYADDTPGLQGDCRLTHTFKDAGEILVEVRDTTHRGGGDFTYRLRVGEFPGAATAFPLAAQRGTSVSVGFAGPETIPPVKVAAPKDPALAAIYVAPGAGWPVPVRLSDHPEAAEQEPNDEPAKANKLPVPGGVSGKFDKAKDVDHFAIVGKKGQKLVIATQTFEVNSPTEVLVRVLDSKGAQVAASNPTAPVNRFEFTPPVDGEYVIACEHQNFLSGPNEVYHLSVIPAGPDFSVALAFDRGEAPAGSGSGVFATVTRLNGYGGPVELSIDGPPALGGKFTLPAGQTQAFVPVLVKDGTKPGGYEFHVKATATTDGVTVTRYGTLVDVVKAGFGGMANPPPELLNRCAFAVTDPPFTLKFTADPTAIEKGKGGKILVEATRGKSVDGDIVLAPVLIPPTAPATVKPIAKGQTKGEIGVTVQPAAPLGPTPFVFKATTKVGGKDYAVTPPPVVIDVIEAKKVDPKKEEPKKKDEPKKDKK